MSTLKVPQMISERAAKNLIWELIRHGDTSHREAIKNAPKQDIEAWFTKNGHRFCDVERAARQYFRYAIPFVENLLGATWQMECGGEGQVTASIVNLSDGKPIVEVEGPGELSIAYAAQFESACRSRDRVIQSGSVDELHTLSFKAVASVESYVSYRATIWNNLVPTGLQLSDSKAKKTPFDEKIKLWIPEMTSGKKLNLGGTAWSNFLKLRDLRDDEATHTKAWGQGKSHKQMAECLNVFKRGAVTLLLDLHILFDEAAPSRLIRAKYFPDISC
jgi:hypothetical protein